MTGKIIAIYVPVLLASALAGIPWNTASAGETQDLEALELRISRLEEALQAISSSIASEARDNLGFYQEAGRVMKEASLRIDSLRQRVWELERRYSAFRELSSGLDRLGTEVLGLEKDRIATRKAQERIIPVAQKAVGKRPATYVTRTRRVSSTDSQRGHSFSRRIWSQDQSAKIQCFRAWPPDQGRAASRGIAPVVVGLWGALAASLYLDLWR